MYNNDIEEELTELIGVDAAGKVLEYYAGESVYFPLSIIKASVHSDMRQAFRDGMSYKQIALKFGYTPNYVRRIVHKKIKKDENKFKQTGCKKPDVIKARPQRAAAPKGTKQEGDLFNGMFN